MSSPCTRPATSARSSELNRQFGIEAATVDGTLRFEVEDGEAFIPRLVLGLSVPITSVSVRRPSLDDVFLRITGREIRDELRRWAQIRCGVKCAPE